MFKSGIPWEMLPGKTGDYGMNFWNNLNQWREEGVWDRLVKVLVKKLDVAEKTDLEREVIYSSTAPALCWCVRI